MTDEKFQKQLSALMRAGEYRSAVDFARSCYQNRPDSSIVAENLGVALWMFGDDQEGCRILQELRSHSTISATACIALMRCYISAGERRLAKKVLLEALKKRDCRTKGLPVLASSLGQLGEYALALEVCKELTNRSPDFPDAWYGAAYYQEAMGVGPQFIIPALRRAIQLQPRCIAVRLCLASAYTKIGSWQDAYALVSNIDLDTIKNKDQLDLLAQIADKNQDRL